MSDTFDSEHRKFVLELASKDRGLADIVDDRARLCAHVRKKLGEIISLQSLDNLPNSDVSECEKLNDYQLVKISWLLETLEMNSDFRAKIGSELEKDFEDRESAHGGVIAFRESSLRILMVPGKPLLKGLSGASKNYENYSYSPVEFNLEPQHLFVFHFHAFEEDNSKFASPTNSDLKEAERRKFDGLVFTKIFGKRFDVDYFYVGRDIENRPFDVVLDLGVYEY
ncbi:MAG: hypothetical protein ABIF01_01495 [Candidatus Micrarchaeota archaeon]